MVVTYPKVYAEAAGGRVAYRQHTAADVHAFRDVDLYKVDADDNPWVAYMLGLSDAQVADVINGLPVKYLPKSAFRGWGGQLKSGENDIDRGEARALRIVKAIATGKPVPTALAFTRRGRVQVCDGYTRAAAAFRAGYAAFPVRVAVEARFIKARRRGPPTAVTS